MGFVYLELRFACGPKSGFAFVPLCPEGNCRDRMYLRLDKKPLCETQPGDQVRRIIPTRHIDDIVTVTGCVRFTRDDIHV